MRAAAGPWGRWSWVRSSPASSASSPPGRPRPTGQLVRSATPRTGGRWGSDAPSSAWCFGETIDSRASRFLLHTADGQPVSVSMSTAHDGGEGFVELRTSPLARGIYVLDWQALSPRTDTAHKGSLLFGVGSGPTPSHPPRPTDHGGRVLLVRGAHLAALLLAVGAVRGHRPRPDAVLSRGTWCASPWRDRRSRGLRSRARRERRHPVPAHAQSRRVVRLLGGSDVDDAARQPMGQLWTVQGLVFSSAGVALLVLGRRPGSGWARPTAGLALAGAALADSAAGHAANLPRGGRDGGRGHRSACAGLGSLGRRARGPGDECRARPKTGSGAAAHAVVPEPARVQPAGAVSAAALLGFRALPGRPTGPRPRSTPRELVRPGRRGEDGAVVLTLCVAAVTTTAVTHGSRPRWGGGPADRPGGRRGTGSRTWSPSSSPCWSRPRALRR